MNEEMNDDCILDDLFEDELETYEPFPLSECFDVQFVCGFSDDY